MINKLGLSVGFFLSFFLHFGFIVFAFLYFKEQSYEKTELFHKISLNDFILPQEKQADTKAPEPMQESKPIEQPSPKPTEQPIPKPTAQPSPKPKPAPKPLPAKASSTAKQENTAQSSQASNQAQAQSQSLAKQEQDEIAAQIYKILLAYISKNYPKDALRRNQSGNVLVAFNFGLGGVTNLQIIKSSNVASLDNASLKAIEKTRHLFPKTNKNFAFELPIRFAIK